MSPLQSTGVQAGLSSQPVSCPEPSAECEASLNWSGYSVCDDGVGQVAQTCSACLIEYEEGLECTPQQGDVTYVAGTWNVPRATDGYGQTCTDQENTWYDASQWVGIDGLISTTVEQTGTSVDCYYGQLVYYAWYEFYPSATVLISSVTVSPGDEVSASVSCNSAVVSGSVGANCTVSLTDETSGQSFTSPSTFVPGALLDSANWIQEDSYFDGFLAYTPVSSLTFSNTATTVNGATHPITRWGANVFWIVAVTYDFGSAPEGVTFAGVKADPTALSYASGFTVKFYSAGP
ncbi:MAG TPA: G1 family glutamic endopeptidase [Nitrososphaerales archaeon]|nr:G1 family glutamic endopeptidase [Nitrososphaerales archaeon]